MCWLGDGGELLTPNFALRRVLTVLNAGAETWSICGRDKGCNTVLRKPCAERIQGEVRVQHSLTFSFYLY